MANVLIIGGGASGMAASYSAALSGHRVTLVEQNEKLGKKVYITGKGRCNVTNACETGALLSQVVTNPKFLYSAFYTFPQDALMRLLEGAGCPLKIERGNRVFPVSDHASSVTKAFEKLLLDHGVKILLNTRVKKLAALSDDRISGVLAVQNGEEHFLPADAVILSTGGLSYPVTGSSGDGHRFCKELGITVTDCYPALVSLKTRETFVRELSGLSLKNVALSAFFQGRAIFHEFGEMLFTMNGVSGPLVLTLSSITAKMLSKKGEILLNIDLKPALSAEKLEERLLRDFSANPNKKLKNVMPLLLPSSMVSPVLFVAGVPEVLPVHLVTKEMRASLVRVLKAFPLHVYESGGFSEAVITQGGVSVKEIDPKTMRVLKYRNLYVTGELLDVDALTGGFNLQIAWSTGYLAGMSIQGGQNGL